MPKERTDLSKTNDHNKRTNISRSIPYIVRKTKFSKPRAMWRMNLCKQEYKDHIV
jgi:hypothetical protein